jgi:hypothetical protein
VLRAETKHTRSGGQVDHDGQGVDLDLGHERLLRESAGSCRAGWALLVHTVQVRCEAVL